MRLIEDRKGILILVELKQVISVERMKEITEG